MKNKFPTWRQILLLGELKEPQKLENKIDKQPNIVKVVEIDISFKSIFILTSKVMISLFLIYIIVLLISIFIIPLFGSEFSDGFYRGLRR